MNTANGKVDKFGCLGGKPGLRPPRSPRQTRQRRRAQEGWGGDRRKKRGGEGMRATEVPISVTCQLGKSEAAVPSNAFILPAPSTSLASFSRALRVAGSTQSLSFPTSLTHARAGSHTPPSLSGSPARVYPEASIWNPSGGPIPQTQDFWVHELPGCRSQSASILGGRGQQGGHKIGRAHV